MGVEGGGLAAQAALWRVLHQMGGTASQLQYRQLWFDRPPSCTQWRFGLWQFWYCSGSLPRGPRKTNFRGREQTLRPPALRVEDPHPTSQSPGPKSSSCALLSFLKKIKTIKFPAGTVCVNWTVCGSLRGDSLDSPMEKRPSIKELFLGAPTLPLGIQMSGMCVLTATSPIHDCGFFFVVFVSVLQSRWWEKNTHV